MDLKLRVTVFVVIIFTTMFLIYLPFFLYIFFKVRRRWACMNEPDVMAQPVVVQASIL